jgi:HPr kinase/phosphorylase
MSDQEAQLQQPALRVREFLEKNAKILALEPGLAPSLLDQLITKKRLQKLGMALAGFTEYLQKGRIYVFGNTEARYFETRTEEERRRILQSFPAHVLTCLLVTSGLSLPADFGQFCQVSGIPVLKTTLDSSTAIYTLTEFLELELSPRFIVHGVLVDVFGIGVLIGGESGIGKSECALELILKGHRLVADDVVELRKVGEKHILGGPPHPLEDLLELRGIGIVNVRDMFGISAISRPKEVGFYVQLERWMPHMPCERLGFTMQTRELGGFELPSMIIPVAPGRNLSVLVEIACRVFLMRSHGLHPMGGFAEMFRQTNSLDEEEGGTA